MEDIISQIRKTIGDDSELTASLQSFGWHPHFPAIADEHGTVLIGNRRIRIAATLGITPVITTLTFGTGSEADAERLKLAIISNIGGQPISRDDRKRIAERLYGTGEWTMERIGKALGVSDRTISSDLANSEVASKLKPSKSATNPKGAGRPKSNKPRAPKVDKAREIVRPLVEAGEPIHYRKLRAEHGISNSQLACAVQAEYAVKEAAQAVQEPPVLDWATAPEPVKAKIVKAVQLEQKRLEATFVDRVDARARELLEQTMIPAWVKELSALAWKVTSRKNPMTMQEFNRIRFALHPDTCRNLAPAERNALSQMWEERKDVLVGEKENPITEHYRNLPSTVDELLKMREAVREANRTKAAARKGVQS